MAVVHVAVGVIFDERNRILITRRPVNTHQGGLWEFPGGKLEKGETLEQALARELQEELGISVLSTVRLLQLEHDYGDKKVLLDVCVVGKFSGEARGVEGQALKWVTAQQLAEYQFPAANTPIVDAVMSMSGKSYS